MTNSVEIDFNLYVDTVTAAEMMGVTVEHVSLLCRTHKIEDVLDVRGRWWIPRAAIEMRKDARTATGSPDYKEGEIGTAEMAEIFGEPGKPLSMVRTRKICKDKKNPIPGIRQNVKGQYVAPRKAVEEYAKTRKKA